MILFACFGWESHSPQKYYIILSCCSPLNLLEILWLISLLLVPCFVLIWVLLYCSLLSAILIFSVLLLADLKIALFQWISFFIHWHLTSVFGYSRLSYLWSLWFIISLLPVFLSWHSVIKIMILIAIFM